ncbi:hypothetical protein GF373_07955 [bacterium]|nr:hypothetical protein [bacterium]
MGCKSRYNFLSLINYWSSLRIMVKKSDGSLCAKCTGICCKYITIEIDEPTTKQDHDDIRWYLIHQGISLLIEEERWLLQCPTVCEHLTNDNQCGIYETRPKTCRDYSTENCDYHTVFEGWETDYMEISSAEEYEAYLKEQKAKKKTRKKTKKK